MYRPDSWIHLYICIKILVRVPNRHVLRETQNLEFGRLFNNFLLCEVTRDMQEGALFIVLNPIFFFLHSFWTRTIVPLRSFLITFFSQEPTACPREK